MKVAILGPVTTGSYFGGVAVFDEEIAVGFKKCGCDVVLITNQKDVNAHHEGISIKTINFLTAKNILLREKPDFILASLQYAKYLYTCTTSAKKAYFLHGFFNRSYYGKLASEIAAVYQKLMIRKCNFTFANSYFTKMVNEHFFGIKVDGVFHLGVSRTFASEFDKLCMDKKEEKTILYVGRLVSVKGINKLIEAIELLQKNGTKYKLFIAGDGPGRDELQNLISKKNLNISLLGRLNQRELIKYYGRSEVFVSLNPCEPFGIVFLEALLARCKIVCPYTGGQVEYLNNYAQRVNFVEETSADSIAHGIEKMFTVDNPPPLSRDVVEQYTYDSVAKRIIEHIEVI